MQERIVNPHLTHEFDSLCKPKLPKSDLESPKSCSFISKLLNWFSIKTGSQKTEL